MVHVLIHHIRNHGDIKRSAKALFPTVEPNELIIPNLTRGSQGTAYWDCRPWPSLGSILGRSAHTLHLHQVSSLSCVFIEAGGYDFIFLACPGLVENHQPGYGKRERGRDPSFQGQEIHRDIQALDLSEPLPSPHDRDSHLYAVQRLEQCL